MHLPWFIFIRQYLYIGRNYEIWEGFQSDPKIGKKNKTKKAKLKKKININFTRIKYLVPFFFFFFFFLSRL